MIAIRYAVAIFYQKHSVYKSHSLNCHCQNGTKSGDKGLSAKNKVWRTQKLFGSYLTFLFQQIVETPSKVGGPTHWGDPGGGNRGIIKLSGSPETHRAGWEGGTRPEEALVPLWLSSNHSNEPLPWDLGLWGTAHKALAQKKCQPGKAKLFKRHWMLDTIELIARSCSYLADVKVRMFSKSRVWSGLGDLHYIPLTWLLMGAITEIGPNWHRSPWLDWPRCCSPLAQSRPIWPSREQVSWVFHMIYVFHLGVKKNNNCPNPRNASDQKDLDPKNSKMTISLLSHPPSYFDWNLEFACVFVFLLLFVFFCADAIVIHVTWQLTLTWDVMVETTRNIRNGQTERLTIQLMDSFRRDLAALACLKTETHDHLMLNSFEKLTWYGVHHSWA